MLARPHEVGYVLLSTGSTLNYPAKQRSKLCKSGLKGTEANIEDWAIPLESDGHRLLPCLTWFDSTHICSKAYYVDFIFSPEEAVVKKGGFIEGELGQLQYPEFVSRGIAPALQRWRTYLYDDGCQNPMVGHLNGKRYQPMESLKEKYGSTARGRTGRRWMTQDDAPI